MTPEAAARLPRLMLVTDRRRTRGRDLVEVVARCVAAGVRLIQLREPDLADDELCRLAQRLKERVPGDTILVINGSVRAARTTRSGLHLPARAPRLLGVDLAQAPYGRSVHDDEELRAAIEDGADYLVAGTVFPTDSKPGVSAAGLALIERLGRQAHPRPLYAIGGITVSRVPAVIHCGAHGVAVCGGLLAASDPERVTEGLMLALSVARPAKDRAPER